MVVKHRIDTLNENGHYFPWVYKAYREAESRQLTHGEDAEECFEKTYNVKLIKYGNAVLAIEFQNESDAVMFRLRFI